MCSIAWYGGSDQGKMLKLGPLENLHFAKFQEWAKTALGVVDLLGSRKFLDKCPYLDYKEHVY